MYTDKNLQRAYHRTRATKTRLDEAIKQGRPAIIIAEITERLERQRKEYRELREAGIKLLQE